MDRWTAQRRDDELGRIRGLTTAVGVAAIGATALFGAAVAWGDQVREAKAEQAPADQGDEGGQTPTLAPPVTAPEPQSPSPTPTPKATPRPTPTPKATKSGGS